MSTSYRTKISLVREHYERSLPSALGIFGLSFVVMTYQSGSDELAGPYLFLGLGIGLVTAFRGLVAYQGLKGRISLMRNEYLLEIALLLNSLLWGSVFCLESWHSTAPGIESLISLSMLFGLTSVAPVALIATPWVQKFFLTASMLAPAGIYYFRIYEGQLPKQFFAVPTFLLILFFYQISTCRKLFKMLTKGIENNLRLEVEQKALKETLNKLRSTQDALLNERAKALNSERLAFLGSMASGVAHEINNPLTISGGQIFKIQHDLAKNPNLDLTGEISKKIERIAEMNGRILNIVKGLQYFASERKADAPEVFTLRELMDFSAIFFREKMVTHGIQFEMEEPPAISILGQKNELSQALLNIVENAIGVLNGRADGKVTLSYSVNKSNLEIQIRDNGPGVEPSIFSRIFDPFFTTKDIGSGTGLGLSVARGIIKAHGGSLTCNSAPGQTDFIISLPMVREHKRTRVG